ncbi:MAG TPA: hypothetical protein VGN51_05110 [Acidimicrobiia bacterium]
MVLAILLGTAAVVAGLTAWRASAHSGEAQGEFARSTQALNDANALQQNASQAATDERSLFIAYEGALADQDPVRIADARGLMGPPTLRAIDWWSDQSRESRPQSPFSAANPEWTTPRRIIDARAALDESVAMLAAADEEIHASHNLELLEAMIAIAFLTGGLTATLKSRAAQSMLLGVSVAVLSLSMVGLAILW